MKYFLTKFAAIINEDDINIPKTDLDTVGGNSPVITGLNIFFGIAAAVAVLVIAISALRIVISRGNSQDVTKARDAIIYASVGLVVIMTAFAIVTFVVGRI